MFARSSNLKKHIDSGRCPGAPRLTCPHCDKTFSNRQAKYDHKKRGKCIAVEASGDRSRAAGVVGDHATIHQETFNVENLNVTVEIKDFGLENLEKALTDEIKEWIARMTSYPAKRLGLAKAVWCNQDVPENHNVEEKSIKRRDCSIKVENVWITRLMSEVVKDLEYYLDKIACQFPELRAMRSYEGLRKVIEDEIRSRMFGDGGTSEQSMKKEINDGVNRTVKLEDNRIQSGLKDMVKTANGLRAHPLKIPRPVTEGVDDFFDVARFPILGWDLVNSPSHFTLSCLTHHFLDGKLHLVSVFPRLDPADVSLFLNGKWKRHTVSEFIPLLVRKSKLVLDAVYEDRKRRIMEDDMRDQCFGPKILEHIPPCYDETGFPSCSIPTFRPESRKSSLDSQRRRTKC